jgi:hypothetical protein
MLFRRKRSVPANLTPASRLRVDPEFRDPDAAAVRAAVTGRDWPALRALVSVERPPGDRDFLVKVASLVYGGEEWLPEVAREHLDDPLPLLLYGMRAIDWAWEARTGARARHVSQDRFALFHQRLALAEDCLQDVVRREPGDVTAWTGLITVARGLQMDDDEERRRFDGAVAADPTNVRAHLQMLQNVCHKWGGSHERMFAFAAKAAENGGPGSRLGVLVAQAHLEYWLELGHEGSRYFSSARVRNALRLAADGSVLHPRYVRGKDFPIDHNPFALAFSLAGDRAAARAHFEVLGDHVAEQPWVYYSREPAAAFARERDLAYRG